MRNRIEHGFLWLGQGAVRLSAITSFNRTLPPSNGVDQRTAHFKNWLEINSGRKTWILDESEGVSLEQLSSVLRAQTQLQYRQGESEYVGEIPTEAGYRDM